jgi:transketolase
MPSTQRDAFWNKVYELARKDEDVILVSADMGAPSLDKFRKDLSGQYVNVGIAEQNAILVSAGLSLEGKKVFAYAIAPFITYRCYEQTKLYLAGMNLPVTLVGVGAGFSYDDSGPTHHTVEDIAIMRILPNMTVYNTTDSPMASAFAEIVYRAAGPNYVRLDRKPVPDVHEETTDFSNGLIQLREGTDIAILATGNMVHRALEVAGRLGGKGMSSRVVDVFRIPIREDGLSRVLEGIDRVATLEEHILPGGFGSAVLETLASMRRSIAVQRFGLDLTAGYCYRYGGRAHMQGLYGLDSETLVESILRAF